MKILITGKNGFVGRSLYEYFSQKPEIQLEAVGHKELDLLNEKQVDAFFDGKSFDIVINAAVWNPADGDIQRDKETEADLRMFLNLVKHADKFGKMITFGSGAEYNKDYDIKSVSEDDKPPYLSGSHYGFVKHVIDLLIQNTENVYSLRIFGLYGKYEDYRCKFITGACAKAVLDLPISIRQNVYFDFLYIDDFCEMVYRFICLEKPKYHTYNIVSGKRVDLVELAETVKSISGKDIKIIVCHDGLAKEYTADNKRLISEIGNVKITPHKKAIEALYQYYYEHKNKLDITALLYQRG